MKLKTALKILAGGFLVTCIGCVAPFSKQNREMVDRDLTFNMIAQDPQSHEGKIIILGGEVIITKPYENVTEIEMLQKPLGVDYRPHTSGSRGRFIAKVNAFVDPAEWKEGREVTFIGKVEGAREGKIGEMPYTYTVIDVMEWKLWRELQPYGPVPNPFGYPHIYKPYPRPDHIRTIPARPRGK